MADQLLGTKPVEELEHEILLLRKKNVVDQATIVNKEIELYHARGALRQISPIPINEGPSNALAQPAAGTKSLRNEQSQRQAIAAEETSHAQIQSQVHNSDQVKQAEHTASDANQITDDGTPVQLSNTVTSPSQLLTFGLGTSSKPQSSTNDVSCGDKPSFNASPLPVVSNLPATISTVPTTSSTLINPPTWMTQQGQAQVLRDVPTTTATYPSTTTSNTLASTQATPVNRSTQLANTRYRYAPVNSPRLQPTMPQRPPSAQNNIFMQAANMQARPGLLPLPQSTNAPSQMQPFTPRPRPVSLMPTIPQGQHDTSTTRPALFGNRLAHMAQTAPNSLSPAPRSPLPQSRLHSLPAGAHVGDNFQSHEAPGNAQISRGEKRSPSIEITDQRQRKRTRQSPDRVQTPPLNDQGEEPEEEDGSSPSEKSFLRKQKGGTTRSKNIAQGQPGHRSSWQPPSGPISHNQQRNPQPRHSASRRPIDENYDSEVEEEIVSEPAKRRRAISGTPQVIAEARHESDEESTSTYTGRLRKNRKKPGEQYYPLLGVPLSDTDRKHIELVFAANIGRMIASKICLADPPKPADTIPIGTRIMARFGQTEDNDERYHSVQDFERDVERMLRMYAEMGGPCGKCRFKRAGTDRIMCYRYRMQSAVSARMRMLSDCLKACELEVDANEGQEARLKKVEEYFMPVDFEADSHWDGTRR